MSVGALLFELADVPALPGASCRNHVALFDAAFDGSSAFAARQEARGVCAACPVLLACAEWAESLPQGRRPGGIVAGRLIDASGRYPADEGRRRRSERSLSGRHAG